VKIYPLLWFGTLVLAAPAGALPGQPEPVVADWIRTHGVLSPAPHERLLVRKSDTAARRFEFEASATLPGMAAFPGDKANIIRSERLSFFDLANPVTTDRLQETLRSIYGPEIMMDFAGATVVYRYPPATIPPESTLGLIRGEIRTGSSFGYWWEQVERAPGQPHSGRLVIFEKANADKIQAEIARRYPNP